MKKVAGYITAIIGFLMIVFSALNYLFGWNMQTSGITVIGIVCIVIGTGIVKKTRIS
jgi:hypothetical protein